MGDSPVTRDHAIHLLAEWQSVASARDAIVRLAYEVGLTKMEIHRHSGISRKTIDTILAGDTDA